MKTPQHSSPSGEGNNPSAGADRLVSRILQRFGLHGPNDEFPDYYRMLDLTPEAREDQIVTAIEVRNGLLDAMDPLDPLRARLSKQLRAAARTLLSRDDRAIYDRGVARNQASAMDMRARLDKVAPAPAPGKSKAARPASPTRKRSKSTPLGLILGGVAGLVLLIVGATVAFLFFQARSSPADPFPPVANNQTGGKEQVNSGKKPGLPGLPSDKGKGNPPGKPPADESREQLPLSVVKALDALMERARRETRCTAAVLAIERKGVPLHVKAYGYRDKERTQTARPETQFSLPTSGHPMLAAAVRHLIQAKNLSVDTPMLPLMNVKPRGVVIDPRVSTITVRQFLEHKTGWSHDQVVLARSLATKYNLGKPPFPPELLLGILATQKLEKAPGIEVQTSYFFVPCLVDLVQRLSGKHLAEYLRDELLGQKLEGTAIPYQPGEAPVVWNSGRGYLCASAPAILTVMRKFGADGQPGPRPGQSLEGGTNYSTCYSKWREDDINFVILLNGNHQGIADVATSIEKSLDRWISRRSN